MNTQTDGTLNGLSGRLYWRAWKPARPARGLIVLAHGYAEHIGRYEHVAEFLAAKGFAFYAFDQVGHGKSEGRRGHVNAFSDYLDDLQRFIAFAQGRVPSLPTFLLGHSQGGLVSLAYGERHPKGTPARHSSAAATQTGGELPPAELRGIIVSAPALRLALPVPAWKMGLGKALSGIVPSLSLANDIPSQFLTHDQAISGAYAKRDPLVLKKATARWATEFFRAQSDTLTVATGFTYPCLLMHGSDDRIASPEGTRQFFAAAGSTDKTLKIYEGFYHEIFNEIGKEKVFEDVASWLEQHLAQ